MEGTSDVEIYKQYYTCGLRPEDGPQNRVEDTKIGRDKDKGRDHRRTVKTKREV